MLLSSEEHPLARSQLAVHSFWAMFPICASYVIYATPYWLLGVSVFAVIACAIFLSRIAEALGWGGVLGCATALRCWLEAGADYSLRPWPPEVAAVADALSLLSAERTVLVQSGLYPHVRYEPRLELLTHESVADPTNDDAVLLLAPQIGGFPFRDEDLREFVRLPRIRDMPAGLLAVRNRCD